MQEKYMVIDSLEGINSEIEKFGNMIPQTENKELKQTLKVVLCQYLAQNKMRSSVS